MSDRPTPETDALFYRNGYPEVVDSSKAMQLCEKLEQERDWITEKFKLLEGCFNRAERKRDEARTVLERIVKLSINARRVEDYAEWEKAVLAILDICEERKEK